MIRDRAVILGQEIWISDRKECVCCEFGIKKEVSTARYMEDIINTPDISAGQCTRLSERLFLGVRLQMESALAFHDDDKYCIEQCRHAIFIVAAERYGRREEIYL